MHPPPYDLFGPVGYPVARGPHQDQDQAWRLQFQQQQEERIAKEAQRKAAENAANKQIMQQRQQ